MASLNALVLFDMSNFIHRSFHSLPTDKFKRDDGLTTNAVFGTAKLIFSIISEFEKKYANIYPVACFDTAKSKLARMNIDPNYKSTRPAAPNELKHQFSWVRDLIRVMKITQVEMESFEADDIIASLCCQNVNNYDHVIIVSTDKDFNQCMTNENVFVYNIAKKQMQSSQDVYDKFNVIPAHFQLYQALIGDKIDNVSGVKGIGPKIAPALINQADGSLETLIDLAKSSSLIKNKSKIIADNEEVLRNCYTLVSLDKTIPVPTKFAKFTMKGLKQKPEFAAFIKTMNFNSFKKYC